MKQMPNNWRDLIEAAVQEFDCTRDAALLDYQRTDWYVGPRIAALLTRWAADKARLDMY